MKTKSLLAGMLVIMMMAVAGCEPEKNPSKDQEPDTPFTPTFQDGIYVYEDGTVLVESDNGLDRINGLKKAIEDYADSTIITTETQTAVACNNTFLLQRDGRYYVEGKWTVKKNVFIKAAEGDGLMPQIQVIADENGAVNADMIRFEANATLKGIYLLGQEAMTGAHQERMLRLNAGDVKLTLEDCFADYVANFFIRIDGTNCSVYLKNSTFRNLAKESSSNGRLVDTRGNGADTVLIHNCLVYNNLGHITRFDGSTINHLEWTNNTFYNCGTVPEIGTVVSAKIENNILANVGWRNAAKGIGIDEETGETEVDDAIWNVEIAESADISNMSITIRNNNVYNTPELLAIYAKNPETACVPTKLGPIGEYLKEQGKLIYENNISEPLTFDNPAPIRYEFIDKYMADPDQPESNFADDLWAVDEDGITGIIPGHVYTFGYPASAQSATAATDGGKLGIRW